MRRLPLFLLLMLLLATVGGCFSPAAPPAPPAEIPSALTVPRDLAIDVPEFQEVGGPAGLGIAGPSALKRLKQQTTTENLARAISQAEGLISENNLFLNGALFLPSQLTVPVDPLVTTFEGTVTDGTTSFHLRMDFRPFDLNGDGIDEPCSGSTCPVGSAPDLAVCPTEAPEEQLQKICLRAYLDGERFLAGVFDRVPTVENPESGRFRFVILPFAIDLVGSNFAIDYDHRDPRNLRTDISAFLFDSDLGFSDFFSRRQSNTSQEGSEAEGKKTVNLANEILTPPEPPPGGSFHYQSQHFSHLDFIVLEAVTEGRFTDVITSIMPPLCAQISSAMPVNDLICQDLGLSLTPGDFVDLPALDQVVLPSMDEFPATF